MANDSDDEDIYMMDDNCELGHNVEDNEFDVAENNIDEDDQDIRYFESSDSEIACAEDNIETQLPEKKLLQEELASWAARNRCSWEATDELLDILWRNGHSSLPKDSCTLLHTPQDIQSQKREYRTIKLNINIDGVPLFKASNIQMWPILSSFNGLKVFIVALFCGTSKLSSAKEYLHDLVQDLKSITKDGIMFAEQKLDVVVNCFTCDAPARSFFMRIINHTGYYSCKRCIIKGTWKGRVVYNSGTVATRREEKTFNDFGYPQHQKEACPLIECQINCISSFALDYMHLVCLGVVRRLINFWKSGPIECKLSHGQLTEISSKLESFKGSMPSEFARQPRSLFEADRWKATEFRQFLLYTGPLVLKSTLPPKAYHHFLSLSIALSIMLNSDDSWRMDHIEYAKKTIKKITKRKLVERCSFVRKVVYLPYGSGYVFIPMLHKAEKSR
eukprot:gene4176-20363_t